ncbi:TPA: hypothetical protein ACPY5B_004286 [Yersinia enterocolitica]|nr:hypothetical protein [Yersinia alsatica]HDY4888624.1 hypothetical protein [Yersinia enterocolitica]
MNNIEELKSAYRDVELTARNMRGKPEEYRVVTGFCPVNVVEMQAQKIQALIAQLEGAQKERDDLREKVNQADSEWHKMADRILSAGKRAEKAETALSAANDKLLVPVKKFGHNFGKPMGWAVVTNDGMLNGGVHDTERYARAVADSKEYAGKHRVIPLVSGFVEGNADAS